MIDKPTEYAMRAMVYIFLKNKENVKPGFKEIATNIGSPEHYTAKILQVLTKRELIKSVRGPGGGYLMDETKAPATIYEIIMAMEGDSFTHKCGFGLDNCNADTPCPLHSYYMPVREGFIKMTKTVSIETLATDVKMNKAVLNRSNQLL